MRPDGRKDDELRPLKITKGFMPTAEGSALIEMGNTRVICTATLEDRIPKFLKGSGTGWVTAEYSMLPRSTESRSPREAARGKLGGRTMEIQRLIGRSLRAVIDTKKLGERTITVDCDVIQADGGTRTASITGGFIALAEAIKYAMERGMISESPLMDMMAAVSVGVVDGVPVLDLPYVEDVKADVDMNFVMTGSGEFIELQGTAEGRPFNLVTMNKMVVLATKGIEELVLAQSAEIDMDMLKLN